MPQESAIPTGRLGRFARVTAAGVRRRVGRVTDRGASAAEVAELLGTLRGLPTKLGQMAAYVDGVEPHEPGDAWETAMRPLLTAAPRSSPERIRRLVEEELQAPLDQLFVEWEEEPLASASIGQVHRASMHDGRRVVVKVQHPDVADAVESDLANLGLVERAASLLGVRRLDTRRLLGEVAERLREELDYRAEAAHQERFRMLHADDQRIHVPAVVGARSARRVLCSEHVEGLGFEAAVLAPERERAAWCRTLWRFVYKGTVTAGVFNADPHPGNYLFQEDGRVVFLDFGCVVTVSEEQRASDEALHRAALARDEPAFAAAVRRLLSLRGGPQEARSIKQLRAMHDPLFSSPFRVTRAFSAGLLHQMRAFGREALRSGEEVIPLPRGALFMNRLQFGFYSVLARLDAEVDYAAVERAFLGIGR